jgi:hypothetical protein
MYSIPENELFLITTWSGNRILDLDHAKNLNNLAKNPLEFDGPFTVCLIKKDDSSYSFELIDGQHRKHIRQLHSCSNLNLQVLVRLYFCNSETEVVNLFEKINNCKPIKYQHSKESKCHKFVELMKLNFKDMIRSGNSPRPFIRQEELQIAIRDSCIFKDFDDGYSPEQIVAEVVEINNKTMKNIPNIEFSNLPVSIQEKVCRYNFFLGIDRPKFSWLLEALNQLEMKFNPLGI